MTSDSKAPVTDEQGAHDLFYELKPECQAHSDGCKGCAEAIQKIAALLARRALEARLDEQREHNRVTAQAWRARINELEAQLAAASKTAGGGQ